MQWPWKKQAPVETRQEASYSDLVLRAIIDGALGTQGADPLKGAAAEIAAGLYARAFTLAEGGGVYFTPEVLAWVGRSLIRSGEAILLIDPGEPLVPVVSASITGGADEASWRYEVERVGPSGTQRITAPSSAIVHVRYATSPAAPWKGIAPLQFATVTGELAAGLERALAWEAGANVGYVLPAPDDPEDTDAEDALTAKLANLKGRMAIVQSMQAQAPTLGAAPQTDWKPQRLGANPPQSLVDLQFASLSSMLALQGVPPALAGVSLAAVAPAASREAWRQFLHGSVAPLATLVGAEAGRKLGMAVSLSFDRLFASDLQGRARAFQSMVGGGMEPGKAAGLAGLMEAEG